jgi:hypothetical protein
MSPRRNWDSPNPTLASECVPLPPGTKGGGHTRLRVRDSQFRRLEEKLSTLPTLCAIDNNTTLQILQKQIMLALNHDNLKGAQA